MKGEAERLARALDAFEAFGAAEAERWDKIEQAILGTATESHREAERAPPAGRSGFGADSRRAEGGWARIERSFLGKAAQAQRDARIRAAAEIENRLSRLGAALRDDPRQRQRILAGRASVEHAERGRAARGVVDRLRRMEARWNGRRRRRLEAELRRMRDDAKSAARPGTIAEHLETLDTAAGQMAVAIEPTGREARRWLLLLGEADAESDPKFVRLKARETRFDPESPSAPGASALKALARTATTLSHRVFEKARRPTAGMRGFAEKPGEIAGQLEKLAGTAGRMARAIEQMAPAARQWLLGEAVDPLELFGRADAESGLGPIGMHGDPKFAKARETLLASSPEDVSSSAFSLDRLAAKRRAIEGMAERAIRGFEKARPADGGGKNATPMQVQSLPDAVAESCHDLVEEHFGRAGVETIADDARGPFERLRRAACEFVFDGERSWATRESRGRATAYGRQTRLESIGRRIRRGGPNRRGGSPRTGDLAEVAEACRKLSPAQRALATARIRKRNTAGRIKPANWRFFVRRFIKAIAAERKL